MNPLNLPKKCLSSIFNMLSRKYMRKMVRGYHNPEADSYKIESRWIKMAAIFAKAANVFGNSEITPVHIKSATELCDARRAADILVKVFYHNKLSNHFLHYRAMYKKSSNDLSLSGNGHGHKNLREVHVNLYKYLTDTSSAIDQLKQSLVKCGLEENSQILDILGKLSMGILVGDDDKYPTDEDIKKLWSFANNWTCERIADASSQLREYWP
ncbi:MAG: hypothetical protein JNK24_05785 [Alphaproteobacteria bacterium]|nr:hypothetical protein [Alphaproteobacteria bacterium]